MLQGAFAKRDTREEEEGQRENVDEEQRTYGFLRELKPH
jgi:hypothetical protein